VTSARAVLRRLRPRRISHSGCCHIGGLPGRDALTPALTEGHGVADKSDLMALTFATRYRALPILAGMTVAAAIVHSLRSSSVPCGARPSCPITAVTGMAFLGFAVWTRGDGLDDADEAKASRVARSAAVVAAAFFLAELGDKMLARSPSPPSRGSLAPGSGPRWSGSVLRCCGAVAGLRRPSAHRGPSAVDTASVEFVKRSGVLGRCGGSPRD